MLENLRLLKSEKCDFFVCDLLIDLIFRNSMLIMPTLPLKLFMFMMRYYLGDVLSNKIRKRHAKHIFYGEFEANGLFSLVSVCKAVLEVMLSISYG